VKKIHRFKQKGQALTEFALVITLLLTMVLLATDPFLYAANLAVAKLQSFYASREASIYMAHGTPNNCLAKITGILGTPMLFNISSSSLFFDSYPNPNGGPPIENCNGDPDWAPPTGIPVTATFSFVMNTLFWGGTWDEERKPG
jgi:hypothetical protein